MADESTPSTSTQAASPAAQVADAVVSVPITESAPSAPVSPPVTTESTAPVTTEIAKPAVDKSATLLGNEPKSADVIPLKDTKPTDGTEGVKPADGEAPKDEASQSVEPAPLPSYEAFTLPENVTVNDERLGDFTKALGEFEALTKADHAEVQNLGQSLVDRHIAEVQNTIERLNETYINQWNKQKNDWFDAFKSDPEIGGNRMDTTTSSVMDAVGKYAGTPEQLGDFKKLMNDTGVGNNPALIRLIANMDGTIKTLQKKYESEGDVKQPPLARPIPTAKNKIEKRYGTL